jgi:Lrp/AsnC family transcriptional regulator for asnA, asnC and gidA
MVEKSNKDSPKYPLGKPKSPKEILNTVLTLGSRSPIDPTDAELIKYLVEDGRLSNVEIANLLETSEGTVRRRIQTLIDRGFIRGFTALLDYNMFGYVIKVHIDFQVEKKDLEEIAKKLMKLDNICSLYRVIGDYNLSTVIVFKNIAELQEFIDNYSEIKGVNRINYLIVTESYKPCQLTGI